MVTLVSSGFVAAGGRRKPGGGGGGYNLLMGGLCLSSHRFIYARGVERLHFLSCHVHGHVAFAPAGIPLRAPAEGSTEVSAGDHGEGLATSRAGPGSLG